MCGIFGWSGKVLPEAREAMRTFADAIAVATKVRGPHATGVAVYEGGKKSFVAKGPVSSDDFIRCPVWDRALARGQSVIGHCRYATHGSPADNRNNHPFEGGRYALIHNGVVLGYREMARREGVKLMTECDSEVILRVIEAEGGSPVAGIQRFVDAAAKTSADYAVALLDREDGAIRLFRDDGRPCSVVKLPVLGIVAFASTDEILKRGMEEVIKRHDGFPILDGAAGWSCNRDRVYVLRPSTLEVEHETVSVPPSVTYNVGTVFGGSTGCPTCFESKCICSEIAESVVDHE